MIESEGDMRICGSVYTRRRAISAAAAAAAGLLSSLPSSVFASPSAPSKPNILFILADDMGYADLSCYGRREYTTPAIDSLAENGMLFKQAYANSAVCSATRTALMTGRYQDRLAVGLEQPLFGRDVGLPPSHPTLPSLLQGSGYSTFLVGKWHLGEMPNYGPSKSGYEHFWGVRGGAVDYFTHELLGKKDLWDGMRPIEEAGYLTTLIGDKADAIVRSRKDQRNPFFMSLHFTAPHWPWEGPDDQTEAKRLAGSDKVVHYDNGSQDVYAAMVKSMDDQVGRLLATLKELGFAHNTIVIFTSDNGGERFSDTWPFTGKKQELLEGGIRIPSVMQWPAHIKAGSISEQVTISMDWVPTLLSFAGAKPSADYPPDGIDLGSVLAGGEPTERLLCWRYLNLSQEACRKGDWKYLKILGNTFLFNVVKDPLERANVKDLEPKIYQNLVAHYDAWNKTMLPLDIEAFSVGFSGSDLADHFGVESRRILSPAAE